MWQVNIFCGTSYRDFSLEIDLRKLGIIGKSKIRKQPMMDGATLKQMA
jgi:hypothetical protein